jgi:hypothetical protein
MKKYHQSVATVIFDIYFRPCIENFTTLNLVDRAEPYIWGGDGAGSPQGKLFEWALWKKNVGSTYNG